MLAVSAFEVFLKRAFLEPYVRQNLVRDNDEAAQLISNALLGQGQRWREHVAPILHACWDISVENLHGWRDVGRAWAARNRIVHDGEDSSPGDAARHVDACRRVARSLLLARIEHASPSLGSNASA